MLKNLYRSIKNERLPVHDFEKQSAKPEVAKKKFPEEEPKPVVDDSFEINKSSPLYYIIYSAPKSRKFLSIFRFKYSWSLAHVSLAGLKLIIHSKKKDTLKDSITLNIAHSYAEYMVTDSTVKYKFLLYLQNGVVAKFYDTKHENCVDWVMHINASSAMLSSPHSSYTPIFRKSRTYPTEPYKGKIVDLLNIWTLRVYRFVIQLSEISYILKKSLEYKSNNVSKKVMDLSIKATQKEKSRMLRYINTIRSYDHQFLSMYLHKDNPNGMDGLKEKLESLNSDFVDPLM
ncbi:hypothetical protein RF11_11365 [Thelohanellus kitauei]|uniref:PH domain-containing protein n=1 Tax=Thelohanellus kitauei TaxID=669202 RepID=A0A0C2MFJ0_THEKT|nr:hypothetical protein RF11_11365 [Thelohanellus kitauei]